MREARDRIPSGGARPDRRLRALQHDDSVRELVNHVVVDRRLRVIQRDPGATAGVVVEQVADDLRASAWLHVLEIDAVREVRDRRICDGDRLVRVLHPDRCVGTGDRRVLNVYRRRGTARDDAAPDRHTGFGLERDPA